MNITIRPMTPEEWESLRAMRLKAVRMHTGYFMGDPEATENYPATYWQEVLDGNGKRIFGLFDDERIIGITAIFTYRKDPSGLTGDMAYTFIEPEYRGRGLVDLFYKSRIEWALEHTNFTKIVTAHREGNEPSRKAIMRNGFQHVGTQTETWPDGTQETEHRYELDLTALRKQS